MRYVFFFFFSSRRRHTRWNCDWSSDVCSSDLPERKGILEALRIALRANGLVPVLFDFDRPTNRDVSETVLTLACMSLFVIVDLSAPRSAPLELQLTVPQVMVPVVPIIQEKEQTFDMFRNLEFKYDWVL